MSECDLEEAGTSAEITAELRDGQLQIVEVSPFDMEDGTTTETGGKFLQVLNSAGEGVMQLDLLNLTLLRCSDSEDGYRLVANTSADSSTQQLLAEAGALHQDDDDATESYVMMDGDEEESSYMVVEGAGGSLVLLSSQLRYGGEGEGEGEGGGDNTPPPPPPPHQRITFKTTERKAPPTALQLLEKAKAVKKAKALLAASLSAKKGPGRKRTIPLPTAGEVLASPNFKLFLYSCKLCQYRCNASKELTQHRIQVHGGAKARPPPPPAAAAPPAPRTVINSDSLLKCARCHYTTRAPSDLVNHITSTHSVSEKIHQEPQPETYILPSSPPNSESMSSTGDTCGVSTLSPRGDASPGRDSFGEDVMFCDMCGLAAAGRQAFLIHQREAHAD